MRFYGTGGPYTTSEQGLVPWYSGAGSIHRDIWCGTLDKIHVRLSGGHWVNGITCRMCLFFVCHVGSNKGYGCVGDGSNCGDWVYAPWCGTLRLSIAML